MSRYVFLTALAAMFLLVSGAACTHGSGVQIASTDSLPPGDFKLAYQDKANRGASGFSEQLTIHGRLESGGSLYLRLFITNMAGANGRAELTGRITDSEGHTDQIRLKQKRGTWRFQSGEFDVQVGANRVQFTQGEAHITLQGATFSADLHVTSDLPAFRPAGEGTQFGDGYYYQTTVLFPRGKLEGSVLRKQADAESEELEISGRVFAEHRVGNMAIYDMSHRWIQVRDVGEDQTFVLSAFQRTERLGGRVHASMFVADDDGIRVYEPTIELELQDFVPVGKSPYQVPKSLSFRGANGSAGVVKSDRLVSHKSDLGSLSPLVRRLVSVFMNPWTYRHKTRYLIRSSDSNEESFDGDAIYSYMQLK